MADDSQNVHLSSNPLHISHLANLRLHDDLDGYRLTCGQMDPCFHYSEGAGPNSSP